MHKEALRSFQEVNGVEKALISQITFALNEMYIMPCKNRLTGQYTGSILDILTFLQDHYGPCGTWPDRVGTNLGDLVSVRFKRTML